MTRVPCRLRSRVQDLRMDAAGALPQRHAFERHRRHLRRLRRGGEAARIDGRQAAQRLRHRGQFRRRHSLQLRHDDQAAPRRPRRRERRHRRAAGGARFYRRSGRARRPLGFLRRARRRRQRRKSLPRLRQGLDDRRAGRIDQAVPVRRADSSDHRSDAAARHRTRHRAGSRSRPSKFTPARIS